MMAKTQYDINKEIEALILRKDAQREVYSTEEVTFIRQYTGAGGQAAKGARGQGVLYEFYTPGYVAKIMWQLAQKYGYDGGSVLEPSIATGRLIEHAPDPSQVIGFEINPFSRRICEIAFPEGKFYEGYFETAFLQKPRLTTRIGKNGTWLDKAPFSLVIGNPPFGVYRNQYSSFFSRPKMNTMETFFLYYGLELLKPGGLMVYLISSNFMRNGIKYQKAKADIGKIAEIVDAYRLPPVFRFTKVPVDILILRKKTTL